MMRQKNSGASVSSLRSTPDAVQTAPAGISTATAVGLTPGIDAVEWADAAMHSGAGEILLTSMDCDGTKSGYDLELTRTIAGHVSVPVIASGGAGTKEHFYEALTDGCADAALAASLFHYKELEIREVKTYLQEKGVSVRI